MWSIWQRAFVNCAHLEAYARAAGYEVVGWYYDPAVRGADPVASRPGFARVALYRPGIIRRITRHDDEQTARGVRP